MSPSVLQKSFFVVIPQADYPSVPFHIGQMEKCGFENEAKKVTNHFPFPIIFESGKKAFKKFGTSRVYHGRVALPLTCKLSKLLKIIFLLTVVLVTTAACSYTREP